MLLFWDRFSVSKPLSQIQRRTLLFLQQASCTPSFGGLGLRSSEVFDFIIIDTRSGTDLPSVLPAMVSDTYWMVTEEDRMNRRVADQFLKQIERASGSFENRPKLGGFIVNQAIFEGVAAGEIIDAARSGTFEERCIGYIPLDKKARDAFNKDELVVEKYPRSAYSREIRILARYLADPQVSLSAHGGEVLRRVRRRGVSRLLPGVAVSGLVAIVILLVLLVPPQNSGDTGPGSAQSRLDVQAVSVISLVAGTLERARILTSVSLEGKPTVGLVADDFQLQNVRAPDASLKAGCRLRISDVEVGELDYIVSVIPANEDPTSQSACSWFSGFYAVTMSVDTGSSTGQVLVIIDVEPSRN